MIHILTSLIFALFFLSPLMAVAQRNCVDIREGCIPGRGGGLGSSTSRSSQIKINPAAVPTEKAFGVEGILYKNEVDLMLAQGTGRMGAAISPSNAESTFFGPPSLEYIDDIFSRKYTSEKYKGQKITLATAFDLYSKKGSGFRNLSLKLGVMGKYNKTTGALHPGGGLNGNWGPFSFGYSLYKDETEVPYPDLVTPLKQIYKYEVQTYNFGVYLSSLTLDYSNLRLKIEPDADPQVIDLYTANLSLGRFIFTFSHRKEKTPGYYYDYDTKSMMVKDSNDENFGGLQIRLTKNIVAGALYNYYLLREYSTNLTLLF